MGQVPQKHSYTLIGNGRLARHFRHYFSLLGLEFQTWVRGDTDPVPAADFTFILISDKAIESFIHEHAELDNRKLIHCSGSLVTESAESVHPLMTFSHELYSLETYRKIPLITEGTNLVDLPNPVYKVPREDRVLYHALCVLAGNYSVLLWSKLFKELENKWQIPAHAAHPYLEQVTHNLISQGAQALTGPLVRGDEKTLLANLQSLAGDAYQPVYEAFVQAYLKEVSDERARLRQNEGARKQNFDGDLL